MPIISNKATLDSTGFMRGMDRMEGKVKGFSKSLSHVRSAMAGSFAVGGLVAFYNQALKTADGIDNMAKQAGLGVEALQAIKFVAEEAGVGFDTMRPAINQLRRAIAEAKSGNDNFLQSFAKLGIGIDDLKSKNTEQLLFDVGKAMHEGGGSADVATAAVKVMGAESTRLNEILKTLGSEGLDQLISKLKQAGHLLDAETITTLDNAEEGFSRFVRGAKNTGITFVGSVQNMSDHVAAFVTQLTSDTGFDNYIDLLDMMHASTEEVTVATEEATKAVEDLAAARAGTIKDIDAYMEVQDEHYASQLSDAEKLIFLQNKLAEARESHKEARLANDFKEAKEQLRDVMKLERDVERLRLSEEKKILDKQEERMQKAQQFVEMWKTIGKLLANPFLGGTESVGGRGLSGDALARIGATGGNVANTQENLTKRQISILEKSQRTLERIENKEFGAIL